MVPRRTGAAPLRGGRVSAWATVPCRRPCRAHGRAVRRCDGGVAVVWCTGYDSTLGSVAGRSTGFGAAGAGGGRGAHPESSMPVAAGDPGHSVPELLRARCHWPAQRARPGALPRSLPLASQGSRPGILRAHWPAQGSSPGTLPRPLPLVGPGISSGTPPCSLPLAGPGVQSRSLSTLTGRSRGPVPEPLRARCRWSARGFPPGTPPCSLPLAGPGSRLGPPCSLPLAALHGVRWLPSGQLDPGRDPSRVLVVWTQCHLA